MSHIAARTPFLAGALALLSGLAACQQSSLVGGPLDAAEGPPAEAPSPDATGNGGSGGNSGNGNDAAPAGPDAAVAEVIAPAPDAPPAARGPARVVFFYTPLGTVLSAWRPAILAKGEFNLVGILAPLQPIKDRLLIVDGVDNLLHPDVPATGEMATQTLLTGGERAGGNAFSFSFDTALAQSGKTVRFGQLQLGVQAGARTGLTVTYDGSGAGQPPQNNPRIAHQYLFGGADPAVTPPAPIGDLTSFEAVGNDQINLVAAALRFDLTRVVTLSWGDVQGTTKFPWLGLGDNDLRTLAMGSGADGPARQGFIAVQTWFASQFAKLVQTLAATPDALGGSILDNTLVVWVSETGEASTGTGRNIPVVLAGNLGRRLRNNATLTVTGSQRSLWLTIGHAAAEAQAIDATTVDKLGDPALGTTLLGDLFAP